MTSSHVISHVTSEARSQKDLGADWAVADGGIGGAGWKYLLVKERWADWARGGTPRLRWSSTLCVARLLCAREISREVT